MLDGLEALIFLRPFGGHDHKKVEKHCVAHRVDGNYNDNYKLSCYMKNFHCCHTF